MRLRRRTGRTRIELIVIVLVILTAIGLVASLLVQVRGPAERIACAMHMQRMGIAVHDFSDHFKALPASCIAPGYATWAVQIAPFLPQQDGKALQAWDLGLPYYDQPAAVREGQVWVYYCPARRAPVQLSTSGDVPTQGEALFGNLDGALGDYGCAPTSNEAAQPWTSPEADGALIVGMVLEKAGNKIVRWKSRTTLEALQRGQAYTLLLGEKHVLWGGFGQALLGDASIYNGDHPASFARLVDDRHGLAQEPSDPFNRNFGSWHPGICQFLMADGSLFVAGNGMSPALLQKLIPRGGPE